MKPLHLFVALASAYTLGAVWACTSTDVGLQQEPPDAMLMPPLDAGQNEDAGDGNLGLSTWMRFGHLVPGLGPVQLCILAPGSSMWTPLLTPTFPEGGTGEEGGPPDAGADVAADGSQKDAGGMPGDATADGYPKDGGHGDGSPLRDGAGMDASPVDTGPGADEGGAGRDAIDPLTMTGYIRLAGVGTFQIAVLPAGIGTCEGAPLTQPITLDSDEYSTVVLAQTAGGTVAGLRDYLDAGTEAGTLPFGLVTFTDERNVSMNLARTRFVNMSANVTPDAAAGPVSVAVLDSTANLTPLAALVPAGQATAPSQVPPVTDGLGYHDGYPMAAACSMASGMGCLSFRVQPSGDALALPWTSAAASLALSEGSLHTGFVVSAGAETYEVLWCNDLSQEPVPCVLIGQ